MASPRLMFGSLPVLRRLSADLQKQLAKQANLSVFGSGEKLPALPGCDPGLTVVVRGLVDVPFVGAEQVFSPREQAASYWSDEKIQQVATHFRPFIGPAATFLVTEAAQTTTDVHGLYRRLGAAIIDPGERARFLALGPARPALEKAAGSWFGLAAGLAGDRRVTELPMCRVETMIFRISSGDLLALYEAHPEDRPILVDAVLEELAELGRPGDRDHVEAIIGARLDRQDRSTLLAS